MSIVRFLVFSCLFCIGTAGAQEVVFNGDFETGALTSSWKLTGENDFTEITAFDTEMWEFSLALKRRPGPPDGNGGLEQQVHMVAGSLYLFQASIASEYCFS
jgi:hypothetical protein